MGEGAQSRGSFGKPRALVGPTDVDEARREELGAATTDEAMSREDALYGKGKPKPRSEPGR